MGRFALSQQNKSASGIARKPFEGAVTGNGVKRGLSSECLSADGRGGFGRNGLLAIRDLCSMLQSESEQ